MVSAAEAPLVYLFSALLACGSVVLLLVPLVRHVRLFSASRAVFGAVVASLLSLSAAAIVGVTLAIVTPAYFLPIAAVTVALRLASPALLYQSFRDRFEARRAWPWIRLLLGLAYLSFVGILVYSLVEILAGGELPVIAGVSEQLAMGLGACALIVRMALRFRPQHTLEFWPIWMAATLFALAFVVVAPYAFPAFAIVYLLSGLAGWSAGILIVRYLD